MVKDVKVQPVQVITPTHTYQQIISERWGKEGGDVREYSVSVTGNHGQIRVGLTSFPCSKEVLIQIADAIIRVALAQEQGA